MVGDKKKTVKKGSSWAQYFVSYPSVFDDLCPHYVSATPLANPPDPEPTLSVSPTVNHFNGW